MKNLLLAMAVLASAFLFPAATEACTSAMAGAARGAGGRWLLWKHRDSGHADNYVRCFAATDSTHAYVALFNASDTAAREAWIGFNDAGFAVMNTATYNIPAPAPDRQDREGFVMSAALRRCATLADFQRMLRDNGDRLGVQANFGAFDAEGHGAYFEISDRSALRVFPVDSLSAVALGEEWAGGDDDGLLTRTNYSLSGGRKGRLGVSRHCAETHLLDSVTATRRPWASPGEVAAEDFIETLSRSFYLPEKGIDLLDGTAIRRPDNGDVIPRWSSCASVVVEGPLPGENPAETMIMWSVVGFPPLSEVHAVTLDSVPAAIATPPAPRVRERGFVNDRKARSKHAFRLDRLRLDVPAIRARSLTVYPAARHRIRP